MDYGPSDSSGTDDDLPPHQNRVQRTGRVTGNGRSAVVGSVPYHWSSNDMEAQIHHLEQEAYCAVLRAFKAQSDAITWEKESLITELRKELRVSNEEHRELLGRVNADEVILRIREWRQAGGLQSQASHDLVPNPTFSASRKKQKTSQPMPLLSLSVPSFALHPQTVAASMQPPLLATKRGGKKTKPGQTLPGISSVKSLQYLSTGPTGRSQLANNDPLIGRKVMTRWPEDNSFYEAVITDYNPLAGLHALVYDKDTANETWEWVNLKEISPEDIRWDGEDVGISHQGGRGGLGNGHRKSIGRGGAVPGVGRGRGAKGQQKKDFPPSKNGIGKKILDEIEMHQTDTLIKEVERVFGANNPDPIEVERAKKLLKDHEQTLIDAISRLADASDGESEGERQGQSAEIWKKQQNDGNPESTNIEDSMAREDRGDGSDGDQMEREGGIASDDHHQQEGENNN